VRRALNNLVDNALRFGAAGGTIDVMAATSVDGTTLVFGDRGAGLAASRHGEALRRLGRFGRIDAARSAAAAAACRLQPRSPDSTVARRRLTITVLGFAW